MRTSRLLAAVLAAAVAAPAAAQRRPIGAKEGDQVVLPDGEPEAKTDPEAEAKKKAEAEAEAKKKAEAEAKKAEEARNKIQEDERKRAEAEAAAKAAAEEAKRKKAEQELRAKQEAEAKKQAEAEMRQREAYNAARVERILVRTSDATQFRIALRPGAPEVKAVQEVRLDLGERLASPHPTYGDFRPIKGARLVATVTPEAPADKSGKRAPRQTAPGTPPRRFRLHPLEDAGVYGFHVTLLEQVPHEVTLEGAEGESQFKASFKLYPGEWPPPDWEQERSNAQNTSAGRRRPITNP